MKALLISLFIIFNLGNISLFAQKSIPIFDSGVKKQTADRFISNNIGNYKRDKQDFYFGFGRFHIKAHDRTVDDIFYSGNLPDDLKTNVIAAINNTNGKWRLDSLKKGESFNILLNVYINYYDKYDLTNKNLGYLLSQIYGFDYKLFGADYNYIENGNKILLPPIMYSNDVIECGNSSIIEPFKDPFEPKLKQ